MLDLWYLIFLSVQACHAKPCWDTVYSWDRSGQGKALGAYAPSAYSVTEREEIRPLDICSPNSLPVSVDSSTFWSAHRVSFVSQCTTVNGMQQINYAAIVYTLRF